MSPWLKLLALPPSLLVFLTSSTTSAASQDLRWPYNLPPDVKYFPDDEVLIKRDIDIQQKLQRQPVTGVKKMSPDPGEKFYLDYWSFDPEEDMLSVEEKIWSNESTITGAFDQAFRVHSDPQTNQTRLLLARYMRLPGWSFFHKRGFQCPNGTSSCTSIDRPDSCCASGTTCQLIQDTGLGDVGCCPDSETCAGSVSTCASGYSSCPNNPGGGCCLPGYGCFDVGCVQTSTATVLATTSSSSSSSSTTTTTTPPSASTVTVTSTTIVTLSASGARPVSTLTTTVTSLLLSTLSSVSRSTSTVLACSSGYRSCPASLGGGCCPTDRECGSSTCPASTASASVEPPVRPTTELTTATTSSTSVSVSGCPTGFYACSAYYQGGCCQIGRDCDTTSCPAGASTTLISGSSLTIVAPTGSGITAPAAVLTGSCAQGWFTCAQTVGGGCCPSGYECGTSCTATASGGQGSQIGKEPPNVSGAGPTISLVSQHRAFLLSLTASLLSVVTTLGFGIF